jgi:hypothetical protein
MFGVASKGDCVNDVFLGTDFQPHMGTEYGGLQFLALRAIKGQSTA